MKKKKTRTRRKVVDPFNPYVFRTITATGETATGSKITVSFKVTEKAAYYHDPEFLSAGYFIRNFPELKVGGITATIEPLKYSGSKQKQDLQSSDIKTERREK